MEKLIQMARERFSHNMHRQGNKAWMGLLLIALLLWASTGIYVVGADEQGVVLRFGHHVQTTLPGPHIHLPYPIETVLKPKVTKVRRIEVGYRSPGRRNSVDVPNESLMLTGDEYIIDIDLSVQYRVKEEGAADFLFRVRNPPGLNEDEHLAVRHAAETAIRQVIGSIDSIDEALTRGKDRIQAETKTTMQKILDLYKSGILIMAVQLQQVAPPSEVIKAFKDVASAREDRERTKNEALGYRNDILPRAKGDAKRITLEAEAYQAERVARAQGDVHRFLALLKEYRKAKDVTRTRLYLETMENILAETRKVVVDEISGHGVLPFLPLPTPGVPLAAGSAEANSQPNR
jgi:membrane protease subunit HflK